MRLLVTGGLGFIGSNFIRHMMTKYPQYEIVNLDKITYAGNKDNLKDLEESPNYSFVQGDICDKRLVESIMRNVDAVVNFAAETHVDRSIRSSEIFIRTDIFGTHVLLETAWQNKIKRFIHISTDEVYGSIENGHFKEGDLLQPNNPYSASKAGAELLARSYCITHKLPLIITRSSNNFGPYQHPEKLVPCFITRLLKNKKVPLHGNGLAIRDWLYVKDNCEAIDFLMHNGEVGETYNIGGSIEKTNLEITKLLLEAFGKDKSYIEFIRDRPGQDKRYSLDCTKIEKLGWKPKYNFHEALEETTRWYKENEEWWEKITNILIAGANITGHAGAVLNTLNILKEYNIKGFIDNSIKEKEVEGIPIIGGTNPLPELKKFEGAFVAIGENKSRKIISEQLKKQGLKLINVIHPEATIENNVIVGEGVFIGAGVVINDNVRIGNNAIINIGVTIDRGCEIGDNVHITPGVNIATRVKIREGAFLGIGSKILPDIIIGKNVEIGAGEIVSKNMPDK